MFGCGAALAAGTRLNADDEFYIIHTSQQRLHPSDREVQPDSDLGFVCVNEQLESLWLP